MQICFMGVFGLREVVVTLLETHMNCIKLMIGLWDYPFLASNFVIRSDVLSVFMIKEHNIRNCNRNKHL